MHVVDGDTIDVDVDGRNERVRLIGIDTPEIAHESSPADCFGPEAAAFTAELIPEGTEVRLERDIEARDDYGRLLAYVYRGSDELFVNLEIVRKGYAPTLAFEPNTTFAAAFAAAATAADDAGLGLWKSCSSAGPGG